MQKIDFKEIVEMMKTHGIPFYKPINLHIPDALQSLRSGLEFFIGRDFVWLPEYDQVAEWLDNNRGLGLCLYGTNGTGKTVLIQKVIPALLFGYYKKVLKSINYYELNTLADTVINYRMISIDDAGMESECVAFGNKRWIFPEIMDIAEKRNNTVIFSSNLNGEGFCEKYGIRTFERIVATTKRVEFNHKSLRK